MVRKTRATTLQEKFGFADSDLSTPSHDAIMVWLDGEVERIAREFLAPRMHPSEDRISEIMANAEEDYDENVAGRYIPGKGGQYPPWPGLGIPPAAKRLLIDDKVWEYPVTSSTDFVVGFVDLMASVAYQVPEVYRYSNSPTIEDAIPRWHLSLKSEKLLFEVKPSIQSVGETIRQIRMYEKFLKGVYFIVSPDRRFTELLKNQGISFVAVPEDVIP